MTNQPLKDKRIALLGGQGQRPEAKQKLINELGLASLEWIVSHPDSPKPIENFCDGLYPGKYDYIFVLVKFSNNVIWNKLKVRKPDDIPVVKVKGSYNAQNFIAALFEQVIQKPEPEPIQEPPKTIITKTLEPAMPDTSNAPRLISEESIDTAADEVKRWQETFGASTPEQAKKKIELREKASEARIEKLKEGKRDEKLINAAYNFHQSFEKFMEGVPLPTYLDEARMELVKLLKKNGLAIEKPKKNIPPTQDDVLDVLIRTNKMFSELFSETKNILHTLSIPKYDKYGACAICKMNKSFGCMPNCPFENLKTLLKFFEEATNINAPDLSPEAVRLPRLPMPMPFEPPTSTPKTVVSIDGKKPVPLQSFPRAIRRFLTKKFDA